MCFGVFECGVACCSVVKRVLQSVHVQRAQLSVSLKEPDFRRALWTIYFLSPIFTAHLQQTRQCLLLQIVTMSAANGLFKMDFSRKSLHLKEHTNRDTNPQKSPITFRKSALLYCTKKLCYVPQKRSIIA